MQWFYLRFWYFCAWVYDTRYTLTVCDHKLGATLFHTQTIIEWKPFGFWSQTLHFTEKTTPCRKMNAWPMFWLLKLLRSFLQDEHFTVHSNQVLLNRSMGIMKLSVRLMQWELRLSESLLDKGYEKGNLNTQSDPLSRLKFFEYMIPPLDEETPTLPDENTIQWDQTALLSNSDVSDYILLTRKEQNNPQLVHMTSAGMLVKQGNDRFCRDTPYETHFQTVGFLANQRKNIIPAPIWG